MTYSIIVSYALTMKFIVINTDNEKYNSISWAGYKDIEKWYFDLAGFWFLCVFTQ